MPTQQSTAIVKIKSRSASRKSSWTCIVLSALAAEDPRHLPNAKGGQMTIWGKSISENREAS